MHAKALWEQQAAPQWKSCEPTALEIAAAAREAAAGAQFDRAGLKALVWAAVQNGTARILCRELIMTTGTGGTRPPLTRVLARVLAFLPGGVQEPDWGLWARIFQWFAPAANGAPWRLVWYAAPTPRTFPAAGQDLGPEHVNGGYTSPCSTHGIYIYRAEEATRVLIHELLHAACLDEEGWSIPLREAQIETWAELLLVAIRSRGSAVAAGRLWTKQAHWISDVNWKAAAMHNTHDISDYAWRYLIGREQMYARLGVALPLARPAIASTIKSLRFTHPALGF